MAVPTNLITGFLGVGKSTAVIDLLRRREAGSRWAVLVNEYGEVAIDGALIEGSAPDGVSVREVAGGCVCCASAPYLPVAIHFLLLDARPERLLIETTGLGHPARLLDMLHRDYRERLDVRATIGLVDPADFAKPEMRANPIFVDQVLQADVVVMNKLDTATPELIADFETWANALYPPKLLIAGTTHGRLDPAWLDLRSTDERLPLYSEAHQKTAHPHREMQATPAPGRPVQYPSPPGMSPACRGWVFDRSEVFDEGKLLTLLGQSAGVTRLKGVFHLAGEWVSINRTGSSVEVAPTAYRRDSRLEVFSEELDWDEFKHRLLACLAGPRGQVNGPNRQDGG